jgi:hypothetical protein
MAVTSRCEIRVKGLLDERWTAWFRGSTVRSEGDEATISSPVADQGVLHGC